MKHTDIEVTAKAYSDTIIQGWEKLYKLKRQKLYQLLSNYYIGEKALEMGCGDGESTSHLINHFSQIDVVDASLTHLEDISYRFPTVKTINSFFESFSPDSKYDTILATHVLEHLDDPLFVLNKIYSWLSDNGRLLIAVPNALSIHRLVGVKMGLLDSPYSLNKQDVLLGHRRVYDKELLLSLFDETKFRVRKFTGLMFKPISNRQIEENWSNELVEAFFKLGEDFPDYCSEIIVVLDKVT